MYKVITFTYQLTDEQTTIVNNCLSYLDCTSNKLFNIPTHRIEDHVKENTLVITFGNRIANLVNMHIVERKYLNVKLFSLPAPQDLVKSSKNEDNRKEAFTLLQEAKELIAADLFHPTNLTIKDEDLPSIDARQVLLLDKITTEAGQASCFQVTKTGKLIEISKEPLENSKADTFITFEELYTIRSIMDVLEVSEVKVVPTSKENST